MYPISCSMVRPALTLHRSLFVGRGCSICTLRNLTAPASGADYQLGLPSPAKITPHACTHHPNSFIGVLTLKLRHDSSSLDSPSRRFPRIKRRHALHRVCRAFQTLDHTLFFSFTRRNRAQSTGILPSWTCSSNCCATSVCELLPFEPWDSGLAATVAVLVVRPLPYWSGKIAYVGKI